jgi:hypothetical protein
MLFACREKEPECCDCAATLTIAARYGTESQTVNISDTRKVCYQTQEQIREYERMNTDSLTYSNGDVRTDTVFITLCTG